MTETEPAASNTRIRQLGGQEIAFDEEGYFMDDTQWSEDACRVLAAESGLPDMQEEHWRVLYAYRDFYAYNGRAPLNKDLKAATGMSVLAMERLFPGGLKNGARRLCGLPNPKNLPMIYLDNAATSFPKNEAALRQALEQYLTLGASPGRGGYDRAVEAEALVSGARRAIADFFGAPADSRVIFAANATDALNTLIQGLAGEGAHVLSTRLEHNSVLRPLHHMRRKGGLDFDLLAFDTQGYLDPLAVREGLRTDSTAVVMTHASNVLGTVQPVEEIGDMLRKRQGQKVALCVDASQSAGVIPIDMQAANISALAFTGHKSLGGPTGIGALVLAPDLDLQPSRFGGTGVDSKNLFQPDEYPPVWNPVRRICSAYWPCMRVCAN